MGVLGSIVISNVRVEKTILPNYSLFFLFRLYFGEGIVTRDLRIEQAGKLIIP